MYWHYIIDPEKGIIEITLKGACHLEDLMSCASRIKSDELFRRTYDVLADLADVFPSLTSKEVSCFTDYLNTGDPQLIGRLAIVATTPRTTAFAMLFQMHLTAWQSCSIFYNRESAFFVDQE
jgi:hypothetical protein